MFLSQIILLFCPFLQHILMYERAQKPTPTSHKTHPELLNSFCAQSCTLTPSSFLRRCWSTNSHGLGGVDLSQWKLQTNIRAAVSDVNTNNLKALTFVRLCVQLCMCFEFEWGRQKWERNEKGLRATLCVFGCAGWKAFQRRRIYERDHWDTGRRQGTSSCQKFILAMSKFPP